MNLLVDLLFVMSSMMCIEQGADYLCPDTGIIEVVEQPASTVTLLDITLVPVVQPSFLYNDLYLTDYPDVMLNG